MTDWDDDDQDAAYARFTKHLTKVIDECGISTQNAAILLLQHIAGGGFKGDTEEAACAEVDMLFRDLRKH